jgi:hypothetical protein
MGGRGDASYARKSATRRYSTVTVFALRHHERIYLPPHVVAAGGRGRHGSRSGTTVLRHHLVDQAGVDDFGARFRKAR